MAAGVDPNIIQFNFVPARQNSDWKDWIGSPFHRQHTHDVRAIQMVKNGVVSGGNNVGYIHVYTFAYISAILQRETNFVTSCLIPWKKKPFTLILK